MGICCVVCESIALSQITLGGLVTVIQLQNQKQVSIKFSVWSLYWINAGLCMHYRYVRKTRNNNNNTCLMALCPRLPGWAGTRKVNQSEFHWSNDSEWQWHQLGHMQICIPPQTNNYASTPPLSFLQTGCPSCHPTNSIKALMAHRITNTYLQKQYSVTRQYYQFK